MVTKFSKRLFSLFTVLVASAYAFALDVPANKIVDANWLNENLGNKDLVVVDIREVPKSYTKSHIPNAVYWGVKDFRESRFKLPGFIGSPTAFKRLASKSGITPDSTVIFYSDGKEKASYTIATLGVYISEFYGVTNTAILNGGFAAWEKAGFKTSSEKPKVKKTDFKIAKFNTNIVATVPNMDEAVEAGSYALVDGRPAKQYTGEKKHKKVKKAGHVPGAANVFVGSLTKKDGDIYYINTDKATMEKTLTDAKVDLNKPEIWYCNTGWFASGGWFVSKYIAGVQDVRVYEASMVEYSSLPKRKMVK